MTDDFEGAAAVQERAYHLRQLFALKLLTRNARHTQRSLMLPFQSLRTQQIGRQIFRGCAVLLHGGATPV